MINVTAAITRNRMNSVFAMPAEAVAMPPNPKNAAMIASTRKPSAQRSMSGILSVGGEAPHYRAGVVGAIREVSRCVVSVRIVSTRMDAVSGVVVAGGGGFSRDSGFGEHATTAMALSRSRLRAIMRSSKRKEGAARVPSPEPRLHSRNQSIRS